MKRGPTWFELWRASNPWLFSATMALTLATDHRRLRRSWLTAMSQSVDRYLRSPGFVGAMKRRSP